MTSLSSSTCRTTSLPVARSLFLAATPSSHPSIAWQSAFSTSSLRRDWHPAGHISFSSTHPGKRPFADTVEAHYGIQTLWPDHCLIGSHGASLHPDLDLPNTELVLRKGFRTDIDSYSAFLENDGTTSTGLRGYLRDRKLHRLFFTGVAYDFCVGSSAIDGSKTGIRLLRHRRPDRRHRHNHRHTCDATAPGRSQCPSHNPERSEISFRVHIPNSRCLVHDFKTPAQVTT